MFYYLKKINLSVVLVALILQFIFGFCGVVFAANDDEPLEPIQIDLQVPIPGFNFNGGVIYGGSEGKTVGDINCPANTYCVSTIIDYMNAVYKYLVGAAVVFAIVLIMIGGVQWMIGSSVGSIDKARKRITGAASGLFILLFITTILTFVNEDITDGGILTLSAVPKADDVMLAEFKEYEIGNNMAIETDALDTDGNPQKIVNASRGPVIGSARVHEDIAIKLELVGLLLNQEEPDSVGTGKDGIFYNNYTAAVTDWAASSVTEDNVKSQLRVLVGWREPRHQAWMFYKNCVKGNCTGDLATCNLFPEDDDSPWDRQPNSDTRFKLTQQSIDAIGSNNDEDVRPYIGQLATARNSFTCPEVTGYAASVMCDNYTNGFTTDARCHYKLEKLMKNAGFCRSYYTPWKFEFKGKAVEESTANCDWIPGTILLEDPDKCDESTSLFRIDNDPVEYATGKSSRCAVNYAEDCIGAFSDPVNLVTGKCKGELKE